MEYDTDWEYGVMYDGGQNRLGQFRGHGMHLKRLHRAVDVSEIRD